MRKCEVCGTSIPEGRVKALPNVQTCIECSTATPYIGNIVTMGDVNKDETFQEIEIIKDPKILQQLKAQVIHEKIDDDNVIKPEESEEEDE